jgi:hypothetical protein
MTRTHSTFQMRIGKGVWADQGSMNVSFAAGNPPAGIWECEIENSNAWSRLNSKLSRLLRGQAIPRERYQRHDPTWIVQTAATPADSHRA